MKTLPQTSAFHYIVRLVTAYRRAVSAAINWHRHRTKYPSRRHQVWQRASTFLIAAFAVLCPTAATADPVASARIEITNPPPHGGGPSIRATITGKATGADPTLHRVVIYAKTDFWYVQPFVDAPFTKIAPDGTWRSRIHLGYEYAAFLVTDSFVPIPITSALPRHADGIVAATRRSAIHSAAQ